MVEGQAPDTNGRPVGSKELSRQTSLAPSTQLLSPGLQTVGWIFPARMSLCDPPEVTCVARTKIGSPESIRGWSVSVSDDAHGYVANTNS